MLANLKIETRGSRPYRVLLFCRSTAAAEEQGQTADATIQRQEAELRDWAARHIEGETQIGVLTVTDSSRQGLETRKELSHAVGKWDLILMTDLSRIRLFPHIYELLEQAERAGTRVIAIADHFDSAHPHWSSTLIFSRWGHETFQELHAQRIRRGLARRKRLKNDSAAK